MFLIFKLFRNYYKLSKFYDGYLIAPIDNSAQHTKY